MYETNNRLLPGLEIWGGGGGMCPFQHEAEAWGAKA